MLLVMAFKVTAAESAETVIRLGVYESERATEMYRVHQPVIDALEASLAEHLKNPVSIEFHITRNYQTLVERLVHGELDVARVGPATMILVSRENPGIRLLAAEQGTVQSDSLIITSKTSGIDRLQDLRGQRFAFGSSLSTEGRYLAQAGLVDAGIRAADLDFDYLGRHDKVLKAVQLGDYAAGAIKSCVYEKNHGSRTLRVIARIPSHSKLWVGSAAIDPALAEAFRAVLLGMEVSSALEPLEIKAFYPVDRDDYRELETAMEKAKHFGGDV